MSPSGGQPSLVVDVSGKEPVKGDQAQVRVVFRHRGDRVVAFFTSQWRSREAAFSPADFDDFDRFVESFECVKPVFYENL